MKNQNAVPVFLNDYQVPDYLIDKIDLQFELGEEFTLVKSSISGHLNSLSEKKNPSLVLMGEGLELLSISLNNSVLETSQFDLTSESLKIFSIPEKFNVEIEARIKPQENTELEGLYQSIGNFCTQCEPQGFRHITWFPDRPDVMARFTTKIIADEIRYPVLLSNGNLIASGKLPNGKHWATWEDPFKKPCYLFALVAGDFDCLEDHFVTCSGRDVKLKIYVEKNNLDQCAHAMQAVKKAMRWDEEKFGREYDLDIYMIVAVSDFNSGAMENKGLNIFNTQYILAKPETATDLDYIHIESVIAHEYCHNWSGNRVTCRDWFQLSLKEGLTIFRDQTFTADTTSKTVARIKDVNYLRTTQFAEDAGPLAHSVRPDSYLKINNFYTSTIYQKGAEVIRMLQTIVGDETFRKGMDLYFSRHDGQAVTIEEFVKAHEDASEINLTQFRLWYVQIGTPVLTIQDNYDAEKKTYVLSIQQNQNPPLDIPVKIGLLNQSGIEITHDLLRVKQSDNKFIFENISEKPILSLLRHFSAPVKIKYDYSDEALLFLLEHDTDLFNRWEAGQQYAVRLILSGNNPQSDNLVKAFRLILENMQHDKWLLTEILTLPSEKYLAGQMKTVDVDGIHAAREFLLDEIAHQLQEIFLENYHHSHADHAESRVLKNLCLAYLTRLSNQEELAERQFKMAISNNMTDTMAALTCLANKNCKQREPALALFYKQFSNYALVMDKWFALQASSKLPGTLEEVKKLVSHPLFDLKNPNKVYALIRTFGNNSVQFHEKNGAGYQFLTNIILQLDNFNPQIAARMVTPLTDWKRYDANRQKLMREQLEFLSSHKTLSKNLFELVSKSLKENENVK